MNSQFINNERGAALITVMFLFSVAAIIIMALISRQQLDSMRTRNMLEHAQAYEYALAAEELARQIIYHDDSSVTYAGQEWSDAHEDFIVEHGALHFSIDDLQGKFNINNLLGNTVAPAEYFQQLLHLQGMEAGAAQAGIGAIETMAVNGSVDNITALRGTDGWNEHNYELVSPEITALPDSATSLNVNTASDILLKIYMPDEKIYERLVKLRSANGFISEQQLRAIGMNTRGMTVKSNYFRLKATARFNSAVVNLTSILYRSAEPGGRAGIRVVSRNLSRVY